MNDEIIFKANLDYNKENSLEKIFLIGTKRFKIKIEEKYKESIKILEFCIKDKYKDDYNKKEKMITQLLQNYSISKEKIKEVMPQIKEDTFLITISVKEKLIEALDALKNIYNDTDVIIFNHEDTIILIGTFEDINEHVSSISETIYISLYEKCYISYCNIQDYEFLSDLYNDNVYKISLAKKYNLSTRYLGKIVFYLKKLWII